VTFTAGGTVAGTALAEDTAAQAAYGVMDQTIATILSSSVEASALASWLVGLYAQPQYRVDTLTVSLDGITPVQKASVLDLELGDVVTVGFHAVVDRVGDQPDRLHRQDQSPGAAGSA
jgi:hypothetical protein